MIADTRRSAHHRSGYTPELWTLLAPSTVGAAAATRSSTSRRTGPSQVTIVTTPRARRWPSSAAPGLAVRPSTPRRKSPQRPSRTAVQRPEPSLHGLTADALQAAPLVTGALHSRFASRGTDVFFNRIESAQRFGASSGRPPRPLPRAVIRSSRWRVVSAHFPRVHREDRGRDPPALRQLVAVLTGPLTDRSVPVPVAARP